MPDENRFDGIDEALDNEEEDNPEPVDTDQMASSNSDTQSDTDSKSSGRTDSKPEKNVTTSSTESNRGANDLNRPAFQFGATEATTLYARPSAWEALDDTFFAARGKLRERGVRDIEKRELHDALLRAISPEALADAVEDARE